jgi:protein farnesyltransferase subunit beta
MEVEQHKRKPTVDIPLGDFPVAIDVDAALRWSVMQQGEAIEAGGFRGRSNKLVDGCYSWWVGGGVPVVEALAARAKGDEEEEGELRVT